MKRLLWLLLMLVPVLGWSQDQSCQIISAVQCQNVQVATASAQVLKVRSNGGLLVTFSYTINGSVSANSIVAQGCTANDTCTTLNTYTSTSSGSATVQSGAAYSYYKITPTFTASATGTTIVVTTVITSAVSETTVNATQYPGSDVCAQINNAYAALPSSGGIVDARGFGASAFTCSNAISIGATASKPATVYLSPQTKLTMNVTGGGPAIQIGDASGIICQGATNGSSISGFIGLGSSANVSDLVTNYDHSGNQQSMTLQGCSLRGNSSATMTGALLHTMGIFAGTLIANNTLTNCYGTAILINPGDGTNSGSKNSSDILFLNNNVGCSGHTGSKPLVIDTIDGSSAVGRMTFVSGGIQNAGSAQSVVTMDGHGGTQCFGMRFYGVDFEVSSSSADMGTITDCRSVHVDGSNVTGTVGAAVNQWTIAETVAGRVNDIEIDGLSTPAASGFTNLINNTIAGAPCNPACTGTTNGSSRILPKYRYNRTQPEVSDAVQALAYGIAQCGSNCVNVNGTNLASQTMVASVPGTVGARYRFSATVDQTNTTSGCSSAPTLNLTITFVTADSAHTFSATNVPVQSLSSATVTATITLGNNSAPAAANSWRTVPFEIYAQTGTAISFATANYSGGSCTTAPTYTVAPSLQLVEQN